MKAKLERAHFSKVQSGKITVWAAYDDKQNEIFTLRLLISPKKTLKEQVFRRCWVTECRMNNYIFNHILKRWCHVFPLGLKFICHCKVFRLPILQHIISPKMSKRSSLFPTTSADLASTGEQLTLLQVTKSLTYTRLWIH